MIIGIGIDMCDVGKAKKSVEKGTFLSTYYSDSEWEYFESSGKSKYLIMAEHYAAKGAFLKLVGAGVVNADMSVIEIVHGKYGQPYYRVQGWALEEMRGKGIEKITLSTSHSDEIGVAVAIAERDQ